MSLLPLQPRFAATQTTTFVNVSCQRLKNELVFQVEASRVEMDRLSPALLKSRIMQPPAWTAHLDSMLVVAQRISSINSRFVKLYRIVANDYLKKKPNVLNGHDYDGFFSS
jgi:hypothetical protein